MKLVVLTAVLAVCGAAKLDRTYLPPESAKTAGGSPGALQTPFGRATHNQGLDGVPKGGFANDFQGVVVDAAAAGTRSADSGDTGLGGSRQSYGSQDSKVGEAAFRTAGKIAPSHFEDGEHYTPGSADTFRRTSSRFGSQPLGAVDGQVAATHLAGQGFAGQQNFNAGFKTGDERPQAAQERVANTLRFESEVGPESFNYAFETDNGISAEETAVATNGVQAQGAFSYTGDDGQVYSVSYTADEGGYQPRGDHLPTPPPIPEEILRSLEQNARDEAAGLIDDGSYDAKKYNEGGDYSESDSHNGQHGSSGHHAGSQVSGASSAAFNRQSSGFSGQQRSDQGAGASSSAFTSGFSGQQTDNHGSGASSSAFTSGFSRQQPADQGSGASSSAFNRKSTGFSKQQPADQGSGASSSALNHQSSGFSRQQPAHQGSGASSSAFNRQSSGFSRQQPGDQGAGASSSVFNHQSTGHGFSEQTSAPASSGHGFKSLGSFDSVHEPTSTSSSGQTFSAHDEADDDGTSTTAGTSFGGQSQQNNAFSRHGSSPSQGMSSGFRSGQSRSQNKENGFSEHGVTDDGGPSAPSGTAGSFHQNTVQPSNGLNRNTFGQQNKEASQTISQASAVTGRGQIGFNKQAFGKLASNQLNSAPDSSGASTIAEGVVKNQFSQQTRFSTQSELSQNQENESSPSFDTSNRFQTTQQQKSSHFSRNQVNNNGYLPPLDRQQGNQANNEDLNGQQQNFAQTTSSDISPSSHEHNFEQTEQLGLQQNSPSYKPQGFTQQSNRNAFSQSSDSQFNRPQTKPTGHTGNRFSSFNTQNGNSQSGHSSTPSRFSSASAFSQSTNGNSAHSTAQNYFDDESTNEEQTTNRYSQQKFPANTQFGSQQESSRFSQNQFNGMGQSNHRIVSSTQNPQFSQRTSASSQVTNAGFQRDDSYHYDQPSKPFNTPVGQQPSSNRFPTSAPNQFNRLMTSQSQFQDSNLNRFSSNPVHESKQFNTQASSAPSFQTRAQSSAQSSGQFHGSTQQSPGFQKQTTAIPQPFQPLRSTSPSQNNQQFRQSTPTFGSVTASSHSGFSSQATSPSEGPTSPSFVAESSASSQQYDGEIYEYNKPAETLPSDKDQDGSPTDISSQGSFGSQGSQGFKARGQFNDQFSAQSVAGKGEVFSGPRKPPSYDDETGYHY